MGRTARQSELIATEVHLSQFLVERYALGRVISVAQLEALEAHLDTCAECRLAVERFDAAHALQEQFVDDIGRRGSGNLFGYSRRRPRARTPH